MAQNDRVKDQVDMKAASEALGEIFAHPEFRKILEEVENAPEAQRPQVAKRLASSAEFKKRGIPIPPYGKINIKIFDPASGNNLAVSEEPPAS
jgi:hypothetical protein